MLTFKQHNACLEKQRAKGDSWSQLITWLSLHGVSPPPAKRKTKEAERTAYEQKKQKILVAFTRHLDRNVETLGL